MATVSFPRQRPLLQGRGWLLSWVLAPAPWRVPVCGLSCPALGMLSVPEQIILAPVFPPWLWIWDPGLDTSSITLGSTDGSRLLNITRICSFLVPLKIRLEASHAWKCWP